MNASPTRVVCASLLVLCLVATAAFAAEGEVNSPPNGDLVASDASAGESAVTVQAPGAEAQTEPAGKTVEGRYFPPPLTGKERWDKYVKDTYTTFPIFAASLGGAIGDQTRNTPAPWGKTWEGYGKRAGTQYASFAIQTSVYQGGSALFRNEGRYIPCQCEGLWKRAGYALQMSFMTYHNQKKVLDVPQFLGAYAGGMVPVLWYPQGYSVSAQGVQNGTYQLGFVVVVRQIQEFAPELKRFFGKLKP